MSNVPESERANNDIQTITDGELPMGNILAVVQQYDIIKDSAVRGAMIGNSKIFLKLNPQAMAAKLSF
jgi:hypothetical protein